MTSITDILTAAQNGVTAINEMNRSLQTAVIQGPQGSSGAAGAVAVSTALQDNGKGLWYNTATSLYDYGWSSPRGPVANLWDYMDQIYGVGGWSQWSGGTSGSDIAPAMLAAATQLRSIYGRGIILIPGGTYLSSNWDVSLSGHTIMGVGGSQAAQIMFDVAGGSGITINGAGGWSGGGVHGLTIWITSNHVGSVAYAVSITDDGAGGAPDQSFYSDLYIEGFNGGQWYNGFYVDGSGRLVPQGIRICGATDIVVFGTTNTAVYLFNAVQWTLNNIETNGASPGSDVYITGTSSRPLQQTTQVYLGGLLCSGSLHINACKSFQVFGKSGAANFSTDANQGAGFLEVSTAAITGSLGTRTTNFYIV